MESRTAQGRRPASFSSRDSEKTEQQATIKRHVSSEFCFTHLRFHEDNMVGTVCPSPAAGVNQYGRYGKTRAEEDAKKYTKQKEELEKKKDELRNELIALRREKKQVKEEMKNGTGERARHVNEGWRRAPERY